MPRFMAIHERVSLQGRDLEREQRTFKSRKRDRTAGLRANKTRAAFYVSSSSNIAARIPGESGSRFARASVAMSMLWKSSKSEENEFRF